MMRQAYPLWLGNVCTVAGAPAYMWWCFQSPVLFVVVQDNWSVILKVKSTVESKQNMLDRGPTPHSHLAVRGTASSLQPQPHTLKLQFTVIGKPSLDEMSSVS